MLYEPLPLGKTTLSVSPMAWGMWRLRGDDVSAAQGLVEAALDAGLTFFDTADIYGPDNGEPFGASEALLGRVLAQAPHLRQRFVLASKGGIWEANALGGAGAHWVRHPFLLGLDGGGPGRVV